MPIGRGRKIQLDDRVPYYLQLRDLLQTLIDEGQLRPGDKLPSEAELCEEFGVSRTVVRQALQELEQEGRLYRRKGVGSFISRPKIVERFVQKLTGFWEDMAAQRLETHALVLKNEAMPASSRVAENLRLAPGASVIALERLRFIGDEPIQLVTSYVPESACPDIVTHDFSHGSLYAFLEEHGLFLAYGFRTVEAVGANERESHYLAVPVGAPMILIDSVGYLADGTPIEYFHAVHRGNRTRFHIELVRSRDQQAARSRTEPEGLPSATIEVIPSPKH
ncbi:MAG: GntR family transcriptional regulator [Nitrososphaerales archaeon]